MALLELHEAELAAQGWTVIPGFVADRATTRAARELIDGILGPERRDAVPAEEQRGQPGPYPAAGSALPVIQSGGGWRRP